MDPIMYLPIFVAASEATKNDAPTEEVKYICAECGKAIMEPGIRFWCWFCMCFYRMFCYLGYLYV